jgi:hypothetical protein
MCQFISDERCSFYEKNLLLIKKTLFPDQQTRKEKDFPAFIPIL